MPELWTENAKTSFHKATFALAKTRQNPLPPIDYRSQLHSHSIDQQNHLLSLEDELQLADHIAFLAHTGEGFAAIAAVCIEERQDGLIVRLARNKLRQVGVVKGLEQVLGVLQKCCTEGKHRQLD
jgi:hypothetical protein